MKKRTSFIKLTKLWGIIFLTGIGVSIIAIDVIGSHRDFNFSADQMRADYIANQKQIIKQEVHRVVDLISYEKAQSEILTRKKIKSRVYEAYSIARNIYQQNKTAKSKAEIQQIILDVLRSIRFENETGYYFAIRMDGMVMLNTNKPELEGKNLLGLKDTHGKSFIKEMIKIARQSGEGFDEYYWVKPGVEGNNFKKISFIKIFKPYSWIIGAGLYVDDVESQIKANLLSTISRIRFGKEGYIFINRLNGDALVSNGKLFSGTKKLWEVFNKNPEEMKDIFKKEYNAALKPEGDYIYYSHIKLTTPDKESPKASFIFGIPDLQWLVGAGVYLDDVEKDIALIQTILNNQMKKKIFYFILIVIGIVVLFFLFFRWLNRGLSNDFKLFISFFNRAASSDKELDRDTIKFVELDQMAEYANKMLTDRKQAEEALRESEKRYRSFIENFHGIAYRGEIKTWKPIFFHGAVEKITGYSERELIAESPSWHELIHSDDATKLKGKDEIASIPNYSTERQYRIKCKNGKIRWVNEFIRNISDEPGTPKFVEGAIYDISNLREAEEALRTSHEMFLTVLDSIDATIYVADMETHEILFMNKNMKESFGRDMTGEICWKAFRGESEPCEFCTNDQLIDENGKPAGVSVWQGKNPITGRWFINYDRAIKWIDGRLVKLQVATDTTEFKKAEKEKEQLEAQLQQAQKMEAMGTLAGGIAHDFNNILMGIQGRTSLMQMDTDDSHAHFEHLKGIEDYIQSAAGLTKQLLGFARGGKYEIKPTDLNGLIKKETRMFGRTRKEINIQDKFEQNLWTVEVDKRQIEQVLLNIYVNAWQAMPSGGDLYIQTENVIIEEDYIQPYQVEPGKYVKISITDTGVGMDEATKQLIFDPFFTTKEMGRGTGLGLASAYGIIKNHNGFINVYSEKGEGTTFNIYLPASGKEVAKEKEIDEELIKGTGTILLVDDEDMIIEVGQRIIEKLGYKVLTAKNGNEAIEVYKKTRGKIDMVILDMIMPDVDGGETYDKLKEINSDIKVLLSSGYSINGQASEILDRGCNGFIQKPFNIADLSKKIREILDKE